MPKSSNKKGEYTGRVQYRAVQEEVEQMLATGRRALPIYKDLVAAGKLNISYSTFCDYVRGNGERKHAKKKKAGALALPKKRETQTKIGKDTPFFVERLPLEELI
ncbi:hypothetical protein C4J81_15680 [Deltaproteobacteria bacterium Smac51]|nr:hypothetical protein C4J81_15680 [Deltaproteobacteria bacterium Smac51]